MGIRIGLTEDDARATQRQYLRANRKIWQELGFRNFTTRAHDDDRTLILAEIGVRTFQRMVMVAEKEDIDLETARLIGMRNMAKLPTKHERQSVRDAAVNSRAKAEILHFVDQCGYYMKRFNGVNNKFDHEAPYEKQIRLQAKGVAFANLSAAYFKLAKVRLVHAENMSIFGLQDTANPLVGDSDDE